MVGCPEHALSFGPVGVRTPGSTNLRPIDENTVDMRRPLDVSESHAGRAVQGQGQHSHSRSTLHTTFSVLCGTQRGL